MSTITQEVYNENMDAARVGMIVNTESKDLISRTVETVDGIAFGKPVAQGANDKGIIATEAGVTSILGIIVRDQGRPAETPDSFAQYESARVMVKGVIYVEASVAVAAGDPVHVVVATGAFTNTGGVAIANARYDTSAAAAGDIVAVRLS